MNTLQENLKEDTISHETDTPSDSTVPKKNTRTQWNWIQLSGRVVSDVEKKQVKEQTVLTFSLAFETLRKTDKEGSHANFIQVEIWGKMADLYGTILTKGMEIIVTGELFQQRWTSKANQAAQKFVVSAQAIAVSDQTYKPN